MFTYHLEGPDRCGKTTTVGKFAKSLAITSAECIVFHSTRPPKALVRALSGEGLAKYQNKMLDKKFEMTDYCDIPVVFDRSWVGENVYGMKYRGRRTPYCFDGNPNTNIVILFIDTPENIMARDDGDSTFKDVEGVRDELKRYLFAVAEEPLVIIADASKFTASWLPVMVSDTMIDIFNSLAGSPIDPSEFKDLVESHGLMVGGKLA